MNFQLLTLIIPDKPDSERDRVAQAWQAGGGTLLALARFWEPPKLDPATVRLYGNDTFCLVLEQKLSLSLVSPPDTLLTLIDRTWTKRSVDVQTLAQALQGTFPQFIKPLVPKVFKAAIYHSDDELQQECTGLDGETPVLVSEIIDLQAEARTFILDGSVTTCSVYEGAASEVKAHAFATAFAGEHRQLLPRTYVLDVGCLHDGEWVVVEANAAWGAGLNGCNPGAAANCIACATEAI